MASRKDNFVKPEMTVEKAVERIKERLQFEESEELEFAVKSLESYMTVEEMLYKFLEFVDAHSEPINDQYDKSFTTDDLGEYIPYFVERMVK